MLLKSNNMYNMFQTTKYAEHLQEKYKNDANELNANQDYKSNTRLNIFNRVYYRLDLEKNKRTENLNV